MANLDENNLSLCSWCGDNISLESEYSCELCCGIRNCGRHMYHQACLDEHLRKQGQTGAVSGFQCPMGLGKGATCDPCQGFIRSTHRKIPCKNKKKKAAAMQVVPPPKCHVPKPKVPVKPVPAAVPPPAPPAQSLVPQQANKPTPVRTGTVPKGPATAKPQQTNSQLKQIVASLKKEIFSKALDKPKQVPAVAAAVAAPGAAAALRLGKAKQAGAQPMFIPGLEPVDVKPCNTPAPPIPTPPPAKKEQFNLHSEWSAFPSLGNANAAALANQRPGQPCAAAAAATAAGTAINALNPNHATGFVADVSRYNALLAGLGLGDDDDDVSEDGRYGEVQEQYEEPVIPTWASPPPTAPDPQSQAHGLPAISDEVLAYALQHGVEAAGLGPEYAPYIQEVMSAFEELLQEGAVAPAAAAPAAAAAPLWQPAAAAPAAAAAAAAAPLWQAAAVDSATQSQADRAAYLAAEQVVLEAERLAAQAPAAAPLYVHAASPVLPSPKMPELKLRRPLETEEEDVDVDDLLALCLA